MSNGFHLLNRIQFSDIVSPRKLVYVAVQVLNTHAVKGALEQRPKGFNTVRMSKMIDGRGDRPPLVAVIHPKMSCGP